MARSIPTVSREEESWRAESDAETLARAAEIKADKARMAKAAAAAQKMLKDAKTRASAMARISKVKVSKPAPKK